jgi:hypothetical protein
LNEIKIEEPEGNKIQTRKDGPNASKKMTVGYLDVIVIALITALLTVTAYDRFFATKVVMVDLTGFVKEQKELFAKGKIDQAELSANLSRLQTYIKNQPKNQTVITKDVVLANGKEIPLPDAGAGPPSSGKR